MQIAILILIYLVLGFCSFIYWWTKENDFVVADIRLACIATLCGPTTFFVGWFIYNNDPERKNRVLIRKKGG